MNIIVESPADLLKALQNISDRFTDNAHDNLETVLKEIFDESQNIYVPVDTGNLKDSGSLLDSSDTSSGQINFIISYTMPYAEIVHEKLDNFHKSPQSAKYVEIPLMSKLNEIERAYIRAMDSTVMQ